MDTAPFWCYMYYMEALKIPFSPSCAAWCSPARWSISPAGSWKSSFTCAGGTTARKKIQINGRVCLLNSVLFGLACVLLCHVVNPPVMAWLFRIGDTYTVPAASFLFGIYLMDNILSVRSAIQLSNRTEKLHQLQQEVRQHLAAAAENLEGKVAEGRERYLQSVDSMTREFMEGQSTQQLQAHYDAYLDERRRQLQLLRSGQDMFERRLLRSHPNLRSRHDEQLNQLRRRLDRLKTEDKAHREKK